MHLLYNDISLVGSGHKVMGEHLAAEFKRMAKAAGGPVAELASEMGTLNTLGTVAKTAAALVQRKSLIEHPHPPDATGCARNAERRAEEIKASRRAEAAAAASCPERCAPPTHPPTHSPTHPPTP